MHLSRMIVMMEMRMSEMHPSFLTPSRRRSRHHHTTVVRPQSSPQLFLAAQSLLISFFTRPRRSPTRPACQLPLWATFRGNPCEKDRRRRDRTWEAHVWTGRNDNYLLLLQQTYMQCIEVESRDPRTSVYYVGLRAIDATTANACGQTCEKLKTAP
jgi:hypothetical protein